MFVQGPRGYAGSDGPRLAAVDGFLFPGESLSPEAGLERLTRSWGTDPSDFLAHAGGSFAACLYDSRDGQVHLIRDRFGVRPLWYVQTHDTIIVASECRALRPLVETTRVHEPALQEALVFRRVSGPAHPVAPFRQVLPGTVVTLSLGQPCRERQYWRMGFPEPGPGRGLGSGPAGSAGPSSMEGSASEGGLPANGRFASKIDGTDEALRRSYHDLGVAGKPVSVLLSGGVDSSVLAATAKRECSDVLCVIGRLNGYDDSEAERGLFVAEKLGLEVLVVDVDEGQFLADWWDMSVRIEEPARNQNNLVLQQLFRAIPPEYSNVLIGDGAENVFGMGVVPWIQKFEQKRTWVERALTPEAARTLAEGLRRLDGGWAWRLARLLDMEKATFAAGLSAIEYHPEVRRVMWPRVRAETEPVFTPEEARATGWAFGDQFAISTAYTYLQSSIIRQERLAAPHGLFPLYPFFAPSVVEWGLSLPAADRYEGRSKPLVREVCDRYLPAEVSRWPKKGFPVPWREWLEGPLQEVERLLGPGARVRDHVDPEILQAVQRSGDPEGIWTLATLEVVFQELL